MPNKNNIVLKEFEEYQVIRGIKFPKEPKFRQFIITGPPGSGKTTLINKIKGWPDEGYIDLTLNNWWRAQALTYRPREVHLGFPFVGHEEALSVFDEQWMENFESLELEPARIEFPPRKPGLFGTDWRKRYVFEFLLPPPESIYAWRKKRARVGLHPSDEAISHEMVVEQSRIFFEIAVHFQNAGFEVYVREGVDGLPMRIVGTSGEA